MNAETLDEKTQQDIQLELLWMLGVKPESVGLAVEAGVVTLTGHVSDPSIRQEAEQLAWRALGVRSVVNEIQIHRHLNDAQLEDAQLEADLVRAVADAFGRRRNGLD